MADSLAVTTLPIQRIRSGPAKDPIALAAADIAAMFADTLGGQGAMLLLQDSDGSEQLLALAGNLAETARPPAAPFLLAGKDAHDGSQWRSGDDGLWLTVPLAIPNDHARLILTARFAREPSAPVQAAVRLALPSLHAFAAAVGLERSTRRRIGSFESALDRSELAIILLDCSGSLLFANQVAEALLDAGDYLRRKGTGISARDLGEAIRLQVAIEHVCADQGVEGESPVVALKRRHPLRPLLISISPARIEGEDGPGLGATLRIIDPDRNVQPLLEPVCSYYRLSPVETRLACELARGATLDDAALALRIKPQTARSYLKQIFMKTDTNRQSDLIRMLLASVVRALPTGRFRIV